MNTANHVVAPAVSLATRTDQIAAYQRQAAVAPDVRCTRRFEASCDKVFDAWLDPSTSSKWLFTTATSDLHRAELEPWAGGHWTVVDRREGKYFAATGHYLEIDRPHRLIFTFGILQLAAEFVRVAVDIAPAGKGCELTLRHEFLPWMGAQGPETGWHAMFDMLTRALR
jgi:uncharacterized protein YndB with AHSA1/START domain